MTDPPNRTKCHHCQGPGIEGTDPPLCQGHHDVIKAIYFLQNFNYGVRISAIVHVLNFTATFCQERPYSTQKVTALCADLPHFQPQEASI
jgi:hypothetical protein